MYLLSRKDPQALWSILIWWLFQLFLPSGPTLYPLLWELSLDIRPVDLSDSKAYSSLLDWFNWSDKTWLYFSWLGDCLYFIWSHGDQTWSTTWKTILSNSSHVIDYPCGLWSDQTRSEVDQPPVHAWLFLVSDRGAFGLLPASCHGPPPLTQTFYIQ